MSKAQNKQNSLQFIGKILIYTFPNSSYSRVVQLYTFSNVKSVKTVHT